MATNKHKINYSCDLCKFVSSNKTDYERHVNTPKHHKNVQYHTNTVPCVKKNSNIELVFINIKTYVLANMNQSQLTLQMLIFLMFRRKIIYPKLFQKIKNLQPRIKN